jgi:hypothetical protein
VDWARPAIDTYVALFSSVAAPYRFTARVLLAGGYNGDGYDEIAGYLSTAELYDPATFVAKITGSMVEHRDGHTATMLLDGSVLITGGYGGQMRYPGGYLASAELFIPDNTRGAIPVISMDSEEYCVGETWHLRLNGASAATPVTLMGTADGIPWSFPRGGIQATTVGLSRTATMTALLSATTSCGHSLTVRFPTVFV